MGFRLSRSARREWAEKMARQRRDWDFIPSHHPIRTGCFVRFVKKATGDEMQGRVVRHSYGARTGQHTFTIELEGDLPCPYEPGDLLLVKGRNLYDRLLEHRPGEESRGEAS